MKVENKMFGLKRNVFSCVLILLIVCILWKVEMDGGIRRNISINEDNQKVKVSVI